MKQPTRHQLLVEWNATAYTFPAGRCVHQHFEDQAAATPNAVAVGFGKQTLTFRDLNTRANQVAHFLRSCGVGPNVLVGISVERCFEAVIGVLGILKAGGAYVPLDPSYPQERLSFMLQDARAPVLLTQRKLIDNLPTTSASVICLDADWQKIAAHGTHNPEATVSPENLIYVIYTSGSTGRPKGAGVYHRGFMNLMHWFVTEFSITSEDNVLLVSSLSFDLTQKNLYATLLCGGQLHLLPSGPYEPGQIAGLVHQHRITLLNCTPSAFYPLIEPATVPAMERVSSLRCVLLGGEPISILRLKPWLENEICRAEVANTYGPTECTDICGCYRLNRGNMHRFDFVPLGKPIYNVQLAILNPDLSLCDIGQAGELYVAGEGVGAGYINDSALTSAKFIRNPLPEIPGPLIYKTGDLVRYLPDGNIEFLGRMDHQVKIRGFRIELHEIENALASLPAIQESVVIVHQPSPLGRGGIAFAADPRLIAYYVLKNGQSLEAAEIRQTLRQKLPDYMVPSAFMRLERFPLSPNGKVDRRALPGPELSSTAQNPVVSVPQTQAEQAIAKIWQEVLAGAQAGLDDNFFDLGGNSIQLAQVHSKLCEQFKLDLSITKLFEFTTIATLARHLSVQPDGKPGAQEFQDRARKQQQTLARQRHLAIGK
ncbi:non-ribosomal peptide synthetase [Pedosphaera parvula]|nr:amino acid adenylation domain-containing protein [Pedosphaera parvula]